MAEIMCNTGDTNTKPSPKNFTKFFPWACQKLNIQENIIIINARTTRRQSISTQTSTNQIEEKRENSLTQQNSKIKVLSKEYNRSSTVPSLWSDTDVKNIRINTVEDSNGNLLQIKFIRNAKIPKLVFQLLANILPCHPYLTSISVNKGIGAEIIPELENLSKINITELCLDDTALGANYDLLFEYQNNLTNVSLARCSIDDDALKKIAANLAYPLPTSRNLCLLNLASNRISDQGAKYLAKSLRSNRALLYLNLSGNTITDDGSIAILDILDSFELFSDEVKESRQKRVQFLNKLNHERAEKEKGKIISKTKLRKLSIATKPKPAMSVNAKKTKIYKRKVDKISNKNTKFDESDGFYHPFSRKNTFFIDNKIYCYGNTQLAYLNISYNNISYHTVQKLLCVLKSQRAKDREPKGLLHVAIEGNAIPIACEDYFKIEQILQPKGQGKHQTRVKKVNINAKKNEAMNKAQNYENKP